MTVADYVPRVLGNTPPWVWGVLMLLVVLGVRRLKPRRTHLLVAALAPTAFTAWSLTGVLAAAQGVSTALVAAVWASALILGGLTVFVHPRGTLTILQHIPMSQALLRADAHASSLACHPCPNFRRKQLCVSGGGSLSG